MGSGGLLCGGVDNYDLCGGDLVLTQCLPFWQNIVWICRVTVCLPPSPLCYVHEAQQDTQDIPAEEVS